MNIPAILYLYVGRCESQSEKKSSTYFFPFYYLIIVDHPPFISSAAGTGGGGELPVFLEPVNNATVVIGRDASLTCVVDNIGANKVFIIAFVFFFQA